jgi:hypothetical protein
VVYLTYWIADSYKNIEEVENKKDEITW